MPATLAARRRVPGTRVAEMNDDNTPVLVGCGQITQREPDPRAAQTPLALMASAARLAADDTAPAPRCCKRWIAWR